MLLRAVLCSSAVARAYALRAAQARRPPTARWSTVDASSSVSPSRGPLDEAGREARVNDAPPPPEGDWFLDHHRARISGVDGPTWDRLEVAAKCLYDWNGKINVVSRKNLDAQTLIEKHYMPSLALLNVPGLRERLDAGAAVMDVGTGGGFPGLPLAIACPNSKFTLVDSVRKKITVVQACADAAFCRNVDALHKRVPEDFKTERFDLVLGRAVTALPSFIDQVAPVLRRASNPVSGAKLSDDELKFPNGVVYLKGGDFDDELQELNLSPREEWAIEALLGGGYEDVLGGGDKRVIHLSAKDVLTAMRR